MAGTFTPDFKHFRFYNNDGSPSESLSTPVADEDIDVLVEDAITIYHIRFMAEETGGTNGAAGDDWQLECDKNATGFTTGAFLVTAGSSDIQIPGDSLLTDGGSISNRTTNGLTDGTGSFVIDTSVEDADGEILNIRITSGNYTDMLWAIEVQAADVTSGDTYDFRVRLNGSTADVVYTVTPRLSIDSAQSISATAIEVPVIIGDATITAGPVSISATADTLPIVVGDATLLATNDLAATAITLPIVVGDATITIGGTLLSATAITLPIVVGDATITSHSLSATAITLPIVVGDATITAGPVSISATADTLPIVVGDATVAVADPFIKITGNVVFSGNISLSV